MSKNVYCPMIHGGLHINYKNNSGDLGINQCCLSTSPLMPIDNAKVWHGQIFDSIRQINNKNQWSTDCWQCKQIENSGSKSFRQSMIEHFGKRYNLSGPLRIDFLFDRSCNLACTICNPNSSTLWQQYSKKHNLPSIKIDNTSNVDQVIAVLKTLDLSNLEQVQFCGGETLMGTSYWKVAEVLAELVPDADKKLLVGFQTNGTQTIDPKYYKLFEKFKLVKLFISIDGIGEKFNYLRWPADWNQVSANIMHMRENLPVNVMFLIQETLSNFNLFYSDQVAAWIQTNFATNRLGDKIDHSQQLAIHDYLGIDVITEEYVSAISQKHIRNMLPLDWQENPEKIKKMLRETTIHDKIRNQDWRVVFPEITEYYSRYTQ